MRQSRSHNRIELVLLAAAIALETSREIHAHRLACFRRAQCHCERVLAPPELPGEQLALVLEHSSSGAVSCAKFGNCD